MPIYLKVFSFAVDYQKKDNQETEFSIDWLEALTLILI